MRVAPLPIIACLLAAVAAQSGPTSNPPTTPPGFTVTAGKSSTFTWKPTTSGTVTLTLRDGPANNLNKGTVLASGIPNSGSCSFTVPAGTAGGVYTIEISSDSNANDANYSDKVTVEGSNSVESASPSPITSTTVASSSTSTDNRTTTSSSETSATSHTSSSDSSFSSSTLGATKSATSASGTSAPTSSKSTPTGSSSGATAATALSLDNGLLAIVFGILAVF